MSTTPENPPNPAGHGAATPAGGPPPAFTPAASPESPPAAERASAGHPLPAGLAGGVPRLPSLRVTAALSAVMLVFGVAVGAAIGPAPEGSLAGISPWLVPTLRALEAGAGAGPSHRASAPAFAPPPAIAPAFTAAPALAAPSPSSTPTGTAASASPAGSPAAASSAPNAAPPPAGTKTQTKQTTLPATTSVWLIELSGASFSQALAQASSAPYIGTQLHEGTLLSGWSGVEGSALANEAALLAGTPPQTLDTIAQPPCPEGPAGAQCAPETAGALSAADSFLQQTVPTITSLAAYRERGLIVITFGSVGSAAASGLPSGAATATLSTTAPSGVLLLSPFARAGARPSTSFNPASPQQSLEQLLHR